ncbi:hypothetical protein MRB53_030216 [Persea americana]|uniref:Uncharacterized protein n=1 Tax=Persea americana TaxID=3435 RepID=A0ACC2KKS6_PERAE|nr:hypothetical protein MRB53_030216 [Persea americana]
MAPVVTDDVSLSLSPPRHATDSTAVQIIYSQALEISLKLPSLLTCASSLTYARPLLFAHFPPLSSCLRISSLSCSRFLRVGNPSEGETSREEGRKEQKKVLFLGLRCFGAYKSKKIERFLHSRSSFSLRLLFLCLCFNSNWTDSPSHCWHGGFF